MQERDLSRTRRWIADEERRQAERRVGEALRPPAPEWLIERGLGRNNIVAVHTGQCWDPGKRVKPVTREQAIEALRQRVPLFHDMPKKTTRKQPVKKTAAKKTSGRKPRKSA